MDPRRPAVTGPAPGERREPALAAGIEVPTLAMGCLEGGGASLVSRGP